MCDIIISKILIYFFCLSFLFLLLLFSWSLQADNYLLLLSLWAHTNHTAHPGMNYITTYLSPPSLLLSYWSPKEVHFFCFLGKHIFSACLSFFLSLFSLSRHICVCVFCIYFSITAFLYISSSAFGFFSPHIVNKYVLIRQCVASSPLPTSVLCTENPSPPKKWDISVSGTKKIVCFPILSDRDLTILIPFYACDIKNSASYLCSVFVLFFLRSLFT